MVGNGFIRRFDDWLNPVLVKEMRQSLHSRGILLLAGGLAALEMFGLFLVIQSGARPNREAGWAFFIGSIVLFGFCLILLATVYCGRFAKERRAEELDLMNITTLSPWQLVRGKFCSAVVVEAQLFAVALPFMVISFYLCGPGMGWILQIAFLLFFSAWPLFLLGLLIGSFGKRGLVALFFFFICCIFVSQGIVIGQGTVFREQIRVNYYALFWIVLFLFMATVAAVAPAGSDRMRPLRLFLLIAAFGVIPGYRLIGGGSGDGFLRDWGASWILVATVAAYLAAIEGREPGRRVLAELPFSPVLRPFRLLVSSGASSGLLFSLVLAAAGIGVAGIGGGLPEPELISGFGYALFYAGGALWLRRFIGGFFPRFNGFAALCVVLAMFAFLPVLLGGVLNPEFWQADAAPWFLRTSFISLRFKGEGMVWTGLAAGSVGLLLNAGPVVAWFRLASGEKK